MKNKKKTLFNSSCIDFLKALVIGRFKKKKEDPRINNRVKE